MSYRSIGAIILIITSIHIVVIVGFNNEIKFWVVSSDFALSVAFGLLMNSWVVAGVLWFIGLALILKRPTTNEEWEEEEIEDDLQQIEECDEKWEEVDLDEFNFFKLEVNEDYDFRITLKKPYSDAEVVFTHYEIKKVRDMTNFQFYFEVERRFDLIQFERIFDENLKEIKYKIEEIYFGDRLGGSEY